MTAERKTDLFQGTLDMLILRTLRLGRAHGHEIAKHIQRTSDEVLLIGVAIVAGLVPARRAAEVDPMTALRAE